MRRSLILLALTLVAVLLWLLSGSAPSDRAPIPPIATETTPPDPIETARSSGPGNVALPTETPRNALGGAPGALPWALTGVVRDLDLWRERQIQVGLGDATIEFWFLLDGELHCVQRTRSAADGRYALDLAPLCRFSADECRRAKMELVTNLPGYRPHSVPVGDRTPAVREQDLWLRSGGVLSGRVVDPSGQPVPGASVILAPCAVGSQPTFVSRQPASTTDTAGRFALSIEVADVYRLYAFDLLRGIAVVDLGPLDRRGRVLPDVRLDARGVLAARVVLADGAPVPAGVRVVVSAVGRARRSRHDLVYEAGGLQSLDSAETRTDGQGCFRVAGLLDGLFDVQVFDDLGRQHVGRAATNAPPIDLTIPCITLAVTVQTPASDRVALADLRIAVGGGSRFGNYSLIGRGGELHQDLLLPVDAELDLVVTVNGRTWSETWRSVPGVSRQHLVLRPPETEERR